jgi:hypothetical protein
LEKCTGITDSLHCSLEEAQERERDAYSEYWDFKKIAHQARLTFLEEKARNLSAESNTSASNILKQIVRREQQREASRRIKVTLKKIRKSGISKVDIEHDNGVFEELTTKRSIEQACMDENKKKFLQTNSTPCMQPPLRQLLGKFGDTLFCQSILRGQCNPPNSTPPFTCELFNHLQYAIPAHDIIETARISKRAFQEG